jgi:hypothetical protein
MQYLRRHAHNGVPSGLMLWMTGSGINIFTIMFTSMAMINPVKAIGGVNQGASVAVWATQNTDSCCAAFMRYSDGGKLDLTQQKLVFVMLHLVSLGIALYKVCNDCMLADPAEPQR